MFTFADKTSEDAMGHKTAIVVCSTVDPGTSSESQDISIYFHWSPQWVLAEQKKKLTSWCKHNLRKMFAVK